MIAPKYKKLAAEYKDRAVFVKVNVQHARDVSSRARVSSMPTFHFYAEGRKKHEFSGAGEQQLKQFTAQIVDVAATANAKLSRDGLVDFYADHDPSKDAAAVEKILKKCGSLAKVGGDCAGGAAKELAKKLKAKFGAAPPMSKRFGGGGGASSSSSSSSSSSKSEPRRKRSSSLDKASVDDLIAELSKRAEGDEVAAVGTDAMETFVEELRREAEEAEEDDFDDEEDEVLPLYRPQSNFAERVVIVGGGPGGLSAAVYAARAGLSPVVVAPAGGGQLLGKGVTIENYPGVLGDTGPGLVTKMQQHAAEAGAVFYPHAALRVDVTKRPFAVVCGDATIEAHALIVATGADSRWLGIEGEEAFKGGGVSSCATCDGFLFRDMDVAVIGGGDTAMEDALVLARTSRSVTVVHRRDAFRASRAMAERVLQHPKISVRWNATVEKFEGIFEEKEYGDEEDVPEGGPEKLGYLKRAILRDTATGEASSLDVAAAFVAIGHDPNTKLFRGQIETAPSGYLTLSGSKFATELSVEGVFAAGDVADAVYRQAITSAGSGAMAALDAERWLSEQGIGDDSEAFNDDLMAELMADLSGAPDVEETVNVYGGDNADILKNANARSEF